MEKRPLYSRYIKRFLDILIALPGLILSLPFLLLAGLLIKLDTPGPALFIQERVGYRSRIFRVYKLRTMDTRAFDSQGKKIRDRDRVTRTGRIIRKLSIDELPQFFNILKGDMSFVGPRPLVVRYLPYYTEEELHRHDVRPGVTGLAQVHGRGYLQWEERFRYDLDYVKKISFGLDVKIILMTIRSVLKREGTSTIRPDNLVDFDKHRQAQAETGP